MKKTLMFATLMAVTVHHGHCQDLVKAPAFEVASITPCKPGTPEPPGEHMGMVQFTSPGGRFKASATSLKFLLEWAYGIQSSQHSSGPSWMETDRYDIIAKAEGNPNDDQMRLMVQTLLVDRFKLKAHRETKKVQAYVVTLGKSAPKLFPPKDEEAHAIHISPQSGEDQKITSYHIVATRYSLKQLTDTFARQLGRVIVNDTGMNSDYNFTMDLTPDESRPNPLDPSLLLTAMRDQLGLTVKIQETPVDFLTIETVEKVVVGN